MNYRPFVAITMGDPVGIGPEIVQKVFAEGELQKWCRPLVIGEAAVLEKAGRTCGLSQTIRPLSSPPEGRYQPGQIDLLNPLGPLSGPADWGQPTPETGRHMEAYITTAIDLSLAGEVAALITSPINKEALQLGGSRFTGHTELLAERTGTSRYAMMLAGDKLRVVLVTIHIPLKEVAPALSVEKIVETITLTVDSLRERFGLETPRLAVAGLNPHAGEGGLFGDEEERLIAPAVAQAIKITGADIVGPLPPDTVFYKAASGQFEAVVCLYHDQGLIPFKMVHFEDGVNTTLGLPIIRTSVDHGTAYDIAGRGQADHRSLLAAIKMAVEQARRLSPT